MVVMEVMVAMAVVLRVMGEMLTVMGVQPQRAAGDG